MEAKSYQLQCFIACKSLQYTYTRHPPPLVTDATHLALIPCSSYMLRFCYMPYTGAHSSFLHCWPWNWVFAFLSLIIGSKTNVKSHFQTDWKLPSHGWRLSVFAQTYFEELYESREIDADCSTLFIHCPTISPTLLFFIRSCYANKQITFKLWEWAESW